MAEASRDGLRLEAIAADRAGDGDTALELLSVNVVLDRDIPGTTVTRSPNASSPPAAACRSSCSPVPAPAGRRAPEPVEVAAYYLVSEAVTNILKPSDSTRASVSVTRRGTQLVVAVADDGAGGADRDTAPGLPARERIDALGGQLEVSIPPGAGTTLRAEIPLQQGRVQRMVIPFGAPG
jgi:hypothetical protein